MPWALHAHVFDATGSQAQGPGQGSVAPERLLTYSNGGKRPGPAGGNPNPPPDRSPIEPLAMSGSCDLVDTILQRCPTVKGGGGGSQLTGTPAVASSLVRLLYSFCRVGSEIPPTEIHAPKSCLRISS